MIDFPIIGDGIAGSSAGAHLSTLGNATMPKADDAIDVHASDRGAPLCAAYRLARLKLERLR